MAAGLKHAKTSAKADDADTTLVRPSDWNADHEGIVTVRKTADENVSSSTTLQDDDHLKFAVAADEEWAFELFLIVEGNETADIKIGFAGPSGSTLVWGGHGLIPAAGNLSAGLENYAGSGSHGFGILSGTKSAIIIRGTIHNGVNADDLQLQWAQNASDAGATTVYENSHLVAHRIA